MASQGRLSAVANKLVNEIAENKIQHMWMRVATHGANSVSKSVMTLLKGQ